MHKYTGFAIGLLFALVVTIIVILLVRKSPSGFPKLPDLHPGKPGIPSKTPEEKEVPSDIIANALKYSYHTSSALDWSARFFRDILKYNGEVESSSKQYTEIKMPSFENIKVILNKGIADIAKYKTDILGFGPADNCDLNDSGSCGYYQALLKMDDNVSFDVAQSVGSRVNAIYQQIPTIVSKSSIDALTKEMYTYVNSVKDVFDTYIMRIVLGSTNASILDSLNSITIAIDALVRRSNDVDESAMRMLSAGNRLATFTTNI